MRPPARSLHQSMNQSLIPHRLQVEATAIVAAAREAEQRAVEAQEDRKELLTRVEEAEEEKVKSSHKSLNETLKL